MKTGDKAWVVFYLKDDLDLPYRWIAEGGYTVVAKVTTGRKKDTCYLLEYSGGAAVIGENIFYDLDAQEKYVFKTRQDALKECKKRNGTTKKT